MSVRPRLRLRLVAAVLAIAGVRAEPALAQHESHESWETVGFTAPQGQSGARLRTSLDPGDPDTVYIGHVFLATGLPGTSGGAGPFHIGRGGYRVMGTGPTGPANNGYWDWDRFNAGEHDSLQGWWPLERGIGTTGGVSVSDVLRPFHGLDHGNLGCYTINQGWPQRTFGVVGYWHRDPGANVPGLPDTGAVVAGPGVEWTPLAGANSAWCGLRGHGDATVVDAVTGNPYAQSVLERSGSLFPGQLFGAQSVQGTDHNYPGYGSQWDQMLYRDIVLPDSGDFDLRFTFRSSMDTRAVTNPATRVGWFDRDPLKPVAPFDGNFISSTDAGAQAPVDSFMVYIGVPTNDSDCLYTDGVRRPIFDPLRRWFSEVLAIDHPRFELYTVAGVHAATTISIPLSGGPGSAIQNLLDADGPGNGGRIRLVFRVKTNRGYDDGDYGITGFSSGTAGAVLLDDVVVNEWDPAEGDFEAPGAIDNLVPAEAAWRATGKPPGIFFHPHSITSLPFADPCGTIGSTDRQCNLSGRVLTPGDHDHSERPGGAPGSPTRDRHDLAGSPTINLRSLGPGNYNAQGIDAEIADATGDLKMVFDLYTGGLKGSRNGNYYQVAWQSYPARQANGLPVWGEIRMPNIVSSFGSTQCLTTVSRGARFDNALVTSNASGVPDSIRVYLQHLTRCFSLSIPSADCSPSSGPDAGVYFDNLALALIDAPSPSLSFNAWDLFTDAFPASRNDSLLALPLGVAFDTCAAHVRTALNIAAPGGLDRPQIPGDTMVVLASGAGQRVDLVFRIVPGVGNHVTLGDRASAVAVRPDQAPRIAALPGDGSWFGEYLLDNGAFGTGAPMDGTSPGPGHPGGVWDPNRWNSARCDTAELNLFPAAAADPDPSRLTPGAWATMLHESDPHYLKLGIPKPRCALIQTGPNAPVDATNITCGDGSYPPAWTNAGSSGFSHNEVPGQPGWTREFTKIIPDGLLTPGAHVQYFFRKSSIASPGNWQMAPDTFTIVPQPVNADLDGHRWQQFSVLPDRWKDVAYGGQGMACMLFVDFGDRRGEELAWVSIMDSIGGTAPARRGAHNGWKARGDQALGAGVNPFNGGDPTMAVAEHLGQPGSVWDLYSVHGAESGTTAGSFGNRLATQPMTGPLASRTASSGPSVAMLRAIYHMLVLDFGDLGGGGAPTLGPYSGKSDDDIALLQGFAGGTGGLSGARVVWALGRSFAESQNQSGTGHPGFTEQFFGAGLRSPSYRAFTGSTARVADLTVVPPIASDHPIYGMLNTCQIDLDLLTVQGSVAGATATSTLDDGTVATGVPPFVAGVRANPSAPHPHFSQLDAFRLPNLGSRLTLTRGGAHRYLLQAVTGLFAAVSCGPLGAPVGIGDLPTSEGAVSALLTLRSANPWRHGEARIQFRLAHTEQADLRVYDLAGRCVRHLIDRRFTAGTEHEVVWDGADDRGRPLSDGVYFYRLRSASFVSERKLTLLRR